MMPSMRPIVLVLFAAAACAPALVSSTMPNPARSKDKIRSSQEYDIGPYKENHRYQVTVTDWSSSALLVEVKIAESGDCAQMQNYSFTLVDDHGAQFPLQPSGPPAVTTEIGRGNATLQVSTLSGAFQVPLGPDSKTITIQQRPAKNVSCSALDFRWDLQ
jgi:hypothetical protein